MGIRYEGSHDRKVWTPIPEGELGEYLHTRATVAEDSPATPADLQSRRAVRFCKAAQAIFPRQAWNNDEDMRLRVEYDAEGVHGYWGAMAFKGPHMDAMLGNAEAWLRECSAAETADAYKRLEQKQERQRLAEAILADPL